MNPKQDILTDKFGRQHTYLRISLTERCNLRCTYCMPAEGISLSPMEKFMRYEEIIDIAQTFVAHGIKKIRITGGEPLIMRNVEHVLRELSKLPVELTLTTNAVLADRFIDVFKECGIKKINVSLDSLDPGKNKKITRRDEFQKVYRNIFLLADEGFKVKVNIVLMKGVNDDEIIDFINLTKDYPLQVRFIEFMPFDGNLWDKSKLVSYADIMEVANKHFTEMQILRLEDKGNDTSKNYQIQGYEGSFGIISTVTSPFCETCNRIRLTADGKVKNCLFSTEEADILTAYRKGEDYEQIIADIVQRKHEMRAGMDTDDKFQNLEFHSSNRTMTSIGG